MISTAIAPVKAKVKVCGDKAAARGAVKLHLKVTGDGRVDNVTITDSPDPAVGACAAAAVQKLTFPKTQTGGSFNYLFPL